MNRNIEIKARADDLKEIQLRAQALSATPPQILLQEDVFFNSPAGRLKLRTINNTDSELIYYERVDKTQPKTSSYLLLPVPDPLSMRQLLGRAYGIRGVVRKRRSLFIVGTTRVHLDEVEGLGDFVELEVVLPADGSEENGVRIARDIMRALGVNETSLISGAYIDLFNSTKDAND